MSYQGAVFCAIYGVLRHPLVTDKFVGTVTTKTRQHLLVDRTHSPWCLDVDEDGENKVKSVLGYHHSQHQHEVPASPSNTGPDMNQRNGPKTARKKRKQQMGGTRAEACLFSTTDVTNESLNPRAPTGWRMAEWLLEFGAVTDRLSTTRLTTVISY